MTIQKTKDKTSVRGISEVIPNVYQVPFLATTAFLLLEENVTVIDAGWRVSGRRMLQFLSDLGRSPEEISYIVSTHFHLDHIGGIAHLQENSSGKIAAHESEVPFLQQKDGHRLPSPTPNQALTLLMAPLFALLKPRKFLVDVHLKDGSKLEPLGGMEIVHTPGHTPGSISLNFPEKGLLMVGDALQYKGGKLGLPSRVFSTDISQAKESIRRLAQLDFEVLCFSHFPPIRIEAAKKLREFAETLE